MRSAESTVTSRLYEALDQYVAGWGPVKWRDDLQSLCTPANSQTSEIFSALANIEDDAFYMNVKLHHAGALRRKPIEQFYTIWSAEESEYARVLSHLAELYGRA